MNVCPICESAFKLDEKTSLCNKINGVDLCFCELCTLQVKTLKKSDIDGERQSAFQYFMQYRKSTKDLDVCTFVDDLLFENFQFTKSPEIETTPDKSMMKTSKKVLIASYISLAMGFFGFLSTGFDIGTGNLIDVFGTISLYLPSMPIHYQLLFLLIRLRVILVVIGIIGIVIGRNLRKNDKS